MKNKKKSTEITTVASQAALDLLRDSFPVEQGVNRILLPRISFVSQDQKEEVKNPETGKKEIKILVEAGTFLTERQTNKIGENGKKVWEKEELGNSFEGIILFQRKQLRHYDKNTEMYTSSPVYDSNEEIIPLFRNKEEIDRGTSTELKSRKIYEGLSAKGKKISKLENNVVLYVLVDDEIFQLSIRGTSMYAFKKYAKNVLPPAVVTIFDSESMNYGTTAWNQITYTVKKHLSTEEIKKVQNHINEIKHSIADEKGLFFSTDNNNLERENNAEKSFREM